jgi:glyoxylase I family protein
LRFRSLAVGFEREPWTVEAIDPPPANPMWPCLLLATLDSTGEERRRMADRNATDGLPSPPARLHHHAFVTTDQEATLKFYEDVVGLPLVATWTEVEHLMGGEEQEFCHTMYELGDGGCLAFFQFADGQFSERFAPPPPFSLFRHFAMLVTSEQQGAIRSRAEDAGLEVTMMADHGYCRSLYLTDPNGLLLEFTVDHPYVEKIDTTRRDSAHRDLARWLSCDHSSNNDWRPTS